MAEIGHNSGDTTLRVAVDELRSFCERIERLKEEQKTIADDIKGVKGEAKLKGYDMTALNEMLKLRAMDPDVRTNREAVRQTYADALGIFG